MWLANWKEYEDGYNNTYYSTYLVGYWLIVIKDYKLN